MKRAYWLSFSFSLQVARNRSVAFFTSVGLEGFLISGSSTCVVLVSEPLCDGMKRATVTTLPLVP